MTADTTTSTSGVHLDALQLVDENDETADAFENITYKKYAEKQYDFEEVVQVVLPKCVLPSVDELSPIESFVEKAILEQNALSETSPTVQSYKALLDALKSKRDPKMLRMLLIALRTSGRGSTLNVITTSSRKHARLIHPILRLNPFDLPLPSQKGTINKNNAADYDVADAQFHFLLAVLSSNAVFIVPTLTFGWKLLTTISTSSSAQNNNINNTNNHHFPEEQQYQRCHAFLASILRVIPTSKSSLFPILSSCAPYRTRTEAELVWYYKQCLIMLEYNAELQSKVIELIIDKLLEIDVEIKVNDAGQAVIDDDADEEQNNNMVFALDLENNAKEAPSSSSSQQLTVDEMAGKLDALMLLLFKYTAHQKSMESQVVLYHLFARVFESSILVCYKSKFVQFVLFYLCGHYQDSLQPILDTRCPRPPLSSSSIVVLYRNWLTRFMHILADPCRSLASRQSAACYLASFVCRGQFVRRENICEAVASLLRWCEAYMMKKSTMMMVGGNTGVDYTVDDDAREQCNQYSLYYTVCQSAFYIMCFRGVEAISYYKETVSKIKKSDDSIDIGQARWTAMCSSPLRPLRFCLESVRIEFLALARAHPGCLLDESFLDRMMDQESHAVSSSFFSSSTKKTHKERIHYIRTPVTLEKERLSGGVGGLGRGENPLDSFFPFDPFLLRRSHAFIEPYYIHWCGVTGECGLRASNNSSVMDVWEEEEEENENDDAVEVDVDVDVDVDDAGEVSRHPCEERDTKVDVIEKDDEDDEDDHTSAAFDHDLPMSFVSTPSQMMPPDDDTTTKAKAWNDIILESKRKRAASVGNGSW